jgi:hypothetical protein
VAARRAYMSGVDRLAPSLTKSLTRLSALLALLVAAFVTGPAPASAPGHDSARALSDAVRALALPDVAAPRPDKQAATRAATPDDQDRPGPGDPPLPAAEYRIAAAEAGSCFAPAAAERAPSRTCATYRARAPPAV